MYPHWMHFFRNPQILSEIGGPGTNWFGTSYIYIQITSRSPLSSKLEDTERKLRSLCECPGSQQLADDIQHNKDIFRLLEDLHEATFQYQICSRTDVLPDVNKEYRWRDK